MAAARFSSRTEDEIAVLRKANKSAAATFRSYLKENNQPTDFETFDKVRLNEAHDTKKKNKLTTELKYRRILRQRIDYLCVRK